MKSSAYSSRKRLGFSEGFRNTFGFAPRVPQPNRKLGVAVAVLAVLGATGVAAAAWQVNDQRTQQEIGKVQDLLGSGSTVIEELEEINERLAMDGYSGDPAPDMVEEPSGDEKLDKEKPTSIDVAIDKLCPEGANNMLGQQQQMLCREMVHTELAQYRFSMRMFERAKENYDRLKDIQERRDALEEDDYANLQYNTNELLALTALMDNDRDRYRTYMSAYEARVAHIENARASLTRNALKGTGGLPSL